MLLSARVIQSRFSANCLLIGFFFFFSFNHIALTQHHYLLGQATFYFVGLALLTSRFKISAKSYFFIGVFLSYCLGTAAFFCFTGENLCTMRPFTATFSILFLFFAAQYVAHLVESKSNFELTIEKYLVYGAWTLIILSIPDILRILNNQHVNAVPFNLDFLRTFASLPYDSYRLRGLTQEPSYFGMVIATIYPICFMRLLQKRSLLKLLLLIGLWICLVFSGSRVGLLSCGLLSFLILALTVPKKFKILITTLGIAFTAWFAASKLNFQLNSSSSDMRIFGIVSIDGSSFVRISHMVAAYRVWTDSLFFGVGLGQSGFTLNQFYPLWYVPTSPEYLHWVSRASIGGIPSFSFLPKLLAEIGLFGLIILVLGCIASMKNMISLANENLEFKKFLFAFFGFLIASFGVDGYLYIPAWLICGVLLGLSRRASCISTPQKFTH